MTTKVCFDITPTLGNRTGIGHVVAQLFESIGDSDEIELIPYTLSYKASRYRTELPNDNIFLNFPASVLTKVWKFFDKPNFDSKFKHADIWHGTNYLIPPTNKKALLTIHDMTMTKYPELVNSQTRDLIPLISKRLKAGAHVHVPTYAIRNDVLEFFKNDIKDKESLHVIPFSVPDISEKQPSKTMEKLASGDPYILCIGTLEPRKNHARLILSFEAIHAKYPNIRMLLVGPDGPARPQIDAAMAKLSNSARQKIVITGPVSHGDRTYLLRKSHVIAYPSLYEGFGLVLLEAMATKTPIVTTKEGSLFEVGGEGAHYVDAYSDEDIARGILDVLDSDELRQRLVKEGIAQASKFSWSKSASMMIKLYKEIAYSVEGK